jgi:hypothetical protein
MARRVDSDTSEHVIIESWIFLQPPHHHHQRRTNGTYHTKELPMATIREIQQVVASCAGFPTDDVHAIGQALAASWNATPHYSSDYPELRLAFTSRLLIALAANAKPDNAAAVADEYYALPNDTIRDSVPTFGAMVECFLLAHYAGKHDASGQIAYRSNFEVCHATPAVRMTTEIENGQKCVDFFKGMSDGLRLSWSAFNDFMPRSYPLPGRVLYHIALELKQLGPIHHATGPITSVAGAAQ